jgi:hypothetical protein
MRGSQRSVLDEIPLNLGTLRSGLMAELVTKRALRGGFSCGVTIHTASHVCGYFFGQDVALVYRPMAGDALFSGLQVARMTEEDEVRDLVHSHPLHSSSPPMGICQLFDFGAVGQNRVVANHALLGGRQAGLIFFGSSGMALETGQAGRGVLFMVEGDRLRGNRAWELLFFSFIGTRLLPERDSAREAMQQHSPKNYFIQLLPRQTRQGKLFLLKAARMPPVCQ